MVGHKKEPAFDRKAILVEADAIPGNQISRDASLNGSPSETKVKVPWYAYIWDYDPGRTKEETAFVQRLDFCVLTILGLGSDSSSLQVTQGSSIKAV
jgi:ACS family pantothenate transporter-like MFS transporter